MKAENKYMSRLLTILTMAVVLLSACVKDTFGGEGEPIDIIEDEMVKLDLYTTTGEYNNPSTRASESIFTNTPMILVYRGSGETAVFSDAVKAQFDGQKSTVTLAESQNPTTILIVANVEGDVFYDGGTTQAFTAANLKTILSGKTLAQTENIIKTVPFGSLQTSLPYPASSALPMTAALYFENGISSTTTLGTDNSRVALTRSVAKASVTIHENLGAGFILEGVGMINAPRNGSYYRAGIVIPENTGSLTNYLKSMTGDGVSGMSTVTSNSTADNPIYIYEIAAGKGTALIIKGRKGSGVSQYYKLDFFHNGKYLDIIRNSHYQFTITEVGTGYSTMTDAINSTGSGIQFNITVSDDYSYDMTTAGDYYIGVSNSAVMLYTQDVQSTITAFQVITNATSALAGNSTGTIKYEGNLSGPATFPLASSSGSPVMTSISVTVPAGFVEGAVTVYVGSIARRIVFTRHSMMPRSGMLELPYSDYTSCEITNRGTGNWLSASPDGTRLYSKSFTRGEPGKMYMVGGLNTGSSIRAGGEVYVTRANSTGRTKIFISQHYI